MSVSVIQDDRTFISTYVKLMNLSKDAPVDQFNSTADYGRLSSLGPSLPRVKASMPGPKAGQPSQTQKTVEVKLKSIKPPFKFDVVIPHIIPALTTMFGLKAQLISILPMLQDARVSPEDIKVMLGSKVIQDSALLSPALDNFEDIALNCMIKAPKATVSAPPKQVSVMGSPAIPSIQESTWRKIEKVLDDDLADTPLATRVMQLFRACVGSEMDLD